MSDVLELKNKPDFNWVNDILMKYPREKRAVLIMDNMGMTTEIQYGKLMDFSMKYANFLASNGFQPGDRFVIMMRMIPDLWYLAVSSSISGMVYSPAPILLSKQDIVYRVSETGARVIFTDSEHYSIAVESVGDLGVRVYNVEDRDFQNLIMEQGTSFAEISKDPQADLAIFFTSGTEGQPKSIAHNGFYPLGHLSTAKWLGLDSSDLHWNISSPGWAKWAWSNLYAPLMVGASAFAFDQDRFSAQRSLNVMRHLPITSLCTAPTVWRMFLLEDLSSYHTLALKKASSAGEPLNGEVISRWEKVTGIRIRDGYGQSESTAMVGNLESVPIKPGSAGKPLAQYDIRIVDESGNEMEYNQEGNIAVRMNGTVPGLFGGYRNDGALNEERFRNGYYYTGDLGFKDPDGYIWFVSRSDDVIKASDYRIGPFEVESALLKHPAVAESAVVASPDEVRGNVVKAYVVLRNGYTPDANLAMELSHHVSSITAPYKRPKKIEFVRELPKTISGKIIRKKLRKLEQDEHSSNNGFGKAGGMEFTTL